MLHFTVTPCKLLNKSDLFFLVPKEHTLGKIPILAAPVLVRTGCQFPATIVGVSLLNMPSVTCRVARQFQSVVVLAAREAVVHHEWVRSGAVKGVCECSIAF